MIISRWTRFYTRETEKSFSPFKIHDFHNNMEWCVKGSSFRRSHMLGDMVIIDLSIDFPSCYCLKYFSYGRNSESKRVKDNYVGPFENVICLGTGSPLQDSTSTKRRRTTHNGKKDITPLPRAFMPYYQDKND